MLFDFSKILTEKEQQLLGDAARWRWISSFRPRVGTVVVHKRHAKWVQVAGNTHAPAHREIMLTLHGSAVYFYNGKCYLRQPGDVFLLDRYERRDLKGSPDKTDFSCLWLYLHNPESLTYHVSTCDKRGRYRHEIPVQTKTGDSIRHIMEAWDQCLSASAGTLCWSFLKTQVAAIMLEVLGRAPIVQPVDHHEQVIASIQEYIQAHLAENLSLHSLARIAGYSPFFFHRLFKHQTGRTLVEYVNDLRLDKALDLLKQNYTVHAVAEAVGFSSASYFNQFFKNHMRLTPAAWSKEWKDV